jgi:hypothetical protein
VSGTRALFALLLALPLSAHAQATTQDRSTAEADAGTEGGEPVEKDKASPSALGNADTPVPEIVEKLPQGVQDVVSNMVESRNPPARFRRSVFGISRARFGVGTSWQPDESPLYAVVPSVKKWGFLGTGNLYTGYNWFGSERGDKRFMGRNNLSVSALREHAKGEFVARVMLSFEPFTVGKRGYPLIAQSGATRDGEPIADRQQALEFFREVAVSYAHELTERWALSLYLAASGEPALGPGAFTHRVSASADPLAPLSFQWQDATNTSYGVITVGAFSRDLKIEASWFNGRAPGERRYGLDIVRMPDSYAGRITWNFAPAFSAQVSYGFLHSPDALNADIAQHRINGSLMWAETRGAEVWAATASIAERVLSNGAASFAGLIEGYWAIDGHHALFSRLEAVQKTGIELVLEQPSRKKHAVGTVVAGYVYYFGPFISLEPGLGLRASVSPLARDLASDYGTRAPLGVMIYAQLRTAALPTKQ